MSAPDDERAPVKRPPEQPQHLHDSSPAPRCPVWRRLFDEALGVALLLVLVVIAVAAVWSVFR